MLGLIVQLAISWFTIWLIERKNLSVLGFRPTVNRLFDFAIFFGITAACCASGVILKIILADQVWMANPKLSISLVLNGIWWNVKSVLFEELIFRGVLLYILIKRLGAARAIIISAMAFGIYHWFSFGVIGNAMGMIITFITTAIMGLLLAYGFTKTCSLYIPIAIHLGWNLTHIFIFSQGPIGNGIFIPVDGNPFRTDSYTIFITVSFFPMIFVLVINYLLLRRRKWLPCK